MRSLVRPFLVILVLVGWPGAAHAELDRLLTPQELAPMIEAGSVLVLDVRDDAPVAGVSPYVAGHIVGAISAPYPRWRGPADNPGALPEEEALQNLIWDLGIDDGKPIVVVHEGRDPSDFGSAARVYWTLKVLGLERLAILNGGMNAWRAAGLPLSAEPVPITRSTYRIDPESALLATREEVEIQLGSPEAARLLDARPMPYFQGKLWHDAAARPGTIKGAENFPYTRWFPNDNSPPIAGPEEARRIATEKGLDAAPVTIVFDDTGHSSAIQWFAMSELAGIPGVKLYPGSMVDWSKAELPMDNVPGRLEWLWLSTKKWLAQAFG